MSPPSVQPPPTVLARRFSLPFGAVIAFVTVDVLLVAACIVTLRQNRLLRNEVVNVQALLAPTKGTTAPPLSGTDWTGKPRTIFYEQDHRPTLVYMFTKRCPFCQDNWRAMRLLQALVPDRLRIVYVDTSGDAFTQQYLDDTGIGTSVLLVDLSSQVVAMTYEARAVPQLVLVNHAGRVQWSHVGELARSDISTALSLIVHDQS